jgi:hypothetical protein
VDAALCEACVGGGGLSTTTAARHWVSDGMTDEMMHALCGRLPALTRLSLVEVKSLTAEGLSAVGGLTSLTKLNLGWNSNVTDVGLQELTSLTSLPSLNIHNFLLYHQGGAR